MAAGAVGAWVGFGAWVCLGLSASSSSRDSAPRLTCTAIPCPSGTAVPGSIFWVMTFPSATVALYFSSTLVSLSPLASSSFFASSRSINRRSGIIICSGPWLIRIVTYPLAGYSSPASGSWEITVPFGSVLFSTVRFTCSPADVRISAAADAAYPFTSGTCTCTAAVSGSFLQIVS